MYSRYANNVSNMLQPSPFPLSCFPFCRPAEKQMLCYWLFTGSVVFKVIF